MKINTYLSKKSLLILACFCFDFFSLNVLANMNISTLLEPEERKEVVESLGKLMKENYVFPDKGLAMASFLNEKLQQGKYDHFSNAQKFTRQLTEDMQSVTHDKHIQVIHAPEQVVLQRKNNSLSSDPEIVKNLKRKNFGFEIVEILPGNIGYLNLTSFGDPEIAGDTAVAAMNYLANSDALIIDLRNNGGGMPAMIQLITSYLYGSESVHLNNFYWRPSDLNTQTWTLPYVQGKRMPNTEVYILTSQQTFSAAEEFSYNLKHLKRAILIGETTMGGAHPGGMQIVNDNFMLWVPSGRAINPITNTNWEGVGVQPHILVNKQEALLRAQIEALSSLSKKSSDKAYYRWHLQSIQAELTPVILDEKLLLQYEGDYGNRVLTVENNELYYQRRGRDKVKLIPLKSDLFYLEGDKEFRIKIIKDKDKVVALRGEFSNGQGDESLRVIL